MQERELVVAFNALGDGGAPESTAQVDDAANHGFAFDGQGDPVDEGAVDLHNVQGEIPEIAQRAERWASNRTVPQLWVSGSTVEWLLSQLRVDHRDWSPDHRVGIDQVNGV